MKTEYGATEYRSAYTLVAVQAAKKSMGRKESRLIEVVKKNRLIAEDSFVAHEAHAFRIATLSPDLERLARSPVSENEAVKHVGAELYGIQFHPELSGESGRRILENFIKLCR